MTRTKGKRWSPIIQTKTTDGSWSWVKPGILSKRRRNSKESKPRKFTSFIIKRRSLQSKIVSVSCHERVKLAELPMPYPTGPKQTEEEERDAASKDVGSYKLTFYSELEEFLASFSVHAYFRTDRSRPLKPVHNINQPMKDLPTKLSTKEVLLKCRKFSEVASKLLKEETRKARLSKDENFAMKSEVEVNQSECKGLEKENAALCWSKTYPALEYQKSGNPNAKRDKDAVGGVSTDLTACKVTDEHLKDLYCKVSHVWKRLARRLNVHDSEIEKIDKTKEDGEEKSLAALKTWKSKFLKPPLVSDIVAALKHPDVQLADVADEIFFTRKT
eukprot:m.4634 g.4634  ORF g.4634 m.4634 type:complete len:330 (+) comp11029_c0_seq2:46-1035(+)